MILSENMQQLVAGSSVIRKMFEEGLEMAKQFGAENVYDFSLGNPASPVPQAVTDAAVNILTTENTGMVHGYMKNAGYDDVRSKLAAHLNEQYGTDYEAGDLIMTVGAAGAMNCVFRALLAAGDEVIVFAPFFGEYRNYVANYGVTLKVIPANTEDFQPDADALRNAITDKTKCVIINNPNNPTGVVYSEETIRAIGEVLKEAEARTGHPVFIVADEPYRELVYDGVTAPFIPAIIPNTIYAYSYSKSLSLPGERIGYLALKKDAAEHDELIGALTVANRILGYVNAPSLFQRVVADCTDVKADVAFYDRNRKLLYEKLTSLKFEVIKPQGAFYLFIKSPVEDETAFIARAKEEHILLVPGTTFGCPGYVRLAYCVSYEMIERSLPAFERLAAVYR